MGDARVAVRRRAYSRERGLTLIELLVTVSIAAVLLGVAIPHMSRDRNNAWTAQIQFLGDMRRTRTDSLTKGDHFQLAMTGPNSYTVYRMRFQAGGWIRGAAVLNRTLPRNITFGTVQGPFEFDTRGLLVTPNATTAVAMNDSYTGHTKGVQVWLSGQVTPQ
jgi:prepilin-type N-terminal cleavage/methylation domain-containing protein